MADNFNYPPDWTPNQSKENRRGNFGHKVNIVKYYISSFQ